MQSKNNLIHLNYNDSIAVDFKSDGSFNATLAAKYFDKRPNDWLALDETNKYIDALILNQLQAGTVIEYNQLVITKKGSPENGGGTWLHEDLAVVYARWLDVRFGVWCDYQIKQILNGANNKGDINKALKTVSIAIKAAKALGLIGNEAMLAANRLVYKTHGFDVLDLLGKPMAAMPLAG